MRLLFALLLAGNLQARWIGSYPLNGVVTNLSGTAAAMTSNGPVAFVSSPSCSGGSMAGPFDATHYFSNPDLQAALTATAAAYQIDLDVYFTSISAYETVFTTDGGLVGSYPNCNLLAVYSSGPNDKHLRWYADGTDSYSTSQIAINTCYHITLASDGLVKKMWVNGVLEINQRAAAAWKGGTFWIGKAAFGSAALAGYVQNFQVQGALRIAIVGNSIDAGNHVATLDGWRPGMESWLITTRHLPYFEAGGFTNGSIAIWPYHDAVSGTNSQTIANDHAGYMAATFADQKGDMAVVYGIVEYNDMGSCLTPTATYANVYYMLSHTATTYPGIKQIVVTHYLPIGDTNTYAWAAVESATAQAKADGYSNIYMLSLATTSWTIAVQNIGLHTCGAARFLPSDSAGHTRLGVLIGQFIDAVMNPAPSGSGFGKTQDKTMSYLGGSCSKL